MPIIQKALKNKNILFFSDMPEICFKVLPFPRDAFLKEHSMLAWAGEAYDADKLTPENFYKKHMFQIKYKRMKIIIFFFLLKPSLLIMLWLSIYHLKSLYII